MRGKWTARLLTGLMVGGLAIVPAGFPASSAWAAEDCGKVPTFSAQITDRPWPLKRLRPDLVWPLTQGEGVIVAVIDSGVSVDHPALKGQVLEGVNFVETTKSAHCDNVGHGTMIAGLIAGKAIPGSGFSGIAPKAKILPMRVLATAERRVDPEDPKRIATAVRMATDQGAKVINMSLTTAPVPELVEAIKYAQAHDVVIVAASGNTGGGSQGNQLSYPAAFDKVIGVAGVDEAGIHVTSSSSGDYVDISAPGTEITGPAPGGGGYMLYPEGGTSFAAAFVSGVAALVRSYRPDLKANDVIRRILRTADRTADNWDPDVGVGVVNPYWAVVSVAASEDEQTAADRVALTPPAPDPLRRVRLVAVWATVLAVIFALLLLLGANVLRRGKDRGWRSGRPT